MLEIFKTYLLAGVSKIEDYLQYVLDWFTSDKGFHFLVCYLLSSIGVTLFGLWAVLGVILVAVGKEWYDTRSTGFDWRDLIADGIGIIAGTIIALI